MEFINRDSNSSKAVSPQTADAIYSALASGDVAAAWLMAEACAPIKDCLSTLFNHAVCFVKLGEWEKALNDLKKAELLLSRAPQSDKTDKTVFFKALLLNDNDQYAMLPLGRIAAQDTEYAELRIKWLSALCCKHAGKAIEAATLSRRLYERYGIKSPDKQE